MSFFNSCLNDQTHDYEKRIFTFCHNSAPRKPPEFLLLEVNSPFDVYLEWGTVPLEYVMGTPIGFQLSYKKSGSTVANTWIRKNNNRHTIVKELEPDKLYIFDVCLVNEYGTGPCFRNSTRTLPSG